MRKGTIERKRTRAEMVLVFWDDFIQERWLMWHLELERIVCHDEGDDESEWAKLIRKAQGELRRYDYGRVKRSIVAMAKMQDVVLENKQDTATRHYGKELK